MFTKLFKKSHDPYELGGRWYKFVYKKGEPVTCDDIFDPDSFHFSSTYRFKLKDGTKLKVVDTFSIKEWTDDAVSTATLKSGTEPVAVYVNGEFGVTVGTSALFDLMKSMTVYVRCI